MSPEWICSQLGAREHYSIPRALHGAGKLKELHTDLWSSGLWQLCRILGAPGRDLAGRFHPDLRSARVHAYPMQGIPQTIRTRRASPAELGDSVLRHSQWLDRQVVRSLRAGMTLFSYTGTFLESARRLHELGGGLAIHGQVDPAASEEEIVAEERQCWPGWESAAAVVPEAWKERRQAEWAEADVIVVNSDWTRTCLQAQGVPEAKLRIVPLAYTPPCAPVPPRQPGPNLRVLWLGQVILRKGIPYLLEAARRLAGEPIEFVVAGSIQISREAVASAPPNVRFIGPVSRSLVSKLYADADVFVLPTLSDGFAITQLEAMAHGLPVIATPRCGEVVLPGRNGRLVPPADSEALTEALASLIADRASLASMSHEALQTSKQFGLDRLAASLLQLVPS